MRGHDRPQATMLTLVNPEQRVPANHPIRMIKQLAEVALKELSPLFEQMYSEVGQPSIPPERLLKASLLMALYTVRSERMLCEQNADETVGISRESWPRLVPFQLVVRIIASPVPARPFFSGAGAHFTRMERGEPCAFPARSLARSM